MLVSRQLEKGIRRSGAIDTESLCIISGEKCFSVRVDVHFMDHDGNFVQAAGIAVIAALLHFRRPDYEIEGSVVKLFSREERVSVPLTIAHIPICTTFSFFRVLDDSVSGERASAAEITTVVDATLEEEYLRDGQLSVTVNNHRDVCQMSLAGGVDVDASSILQCCSMATEHTLRISELVRVQVERDVQRRQAQGASAENDR